ncbi:hypothetical protein V5O48_000538 [Marasmius crinis-equi]|uniref:ZZ-type domain-containing protein n=1 Tax=Marasmius crinis-equi TaxID=585013 RepID=A0ABR3G1P6_9AGAR
MAPMTYSCDSCSQQILATNPRVHCLICDDYDLCANCTLGEQFTRDHTLDHAVTVLKRSGGSGERPLAAERASLSFDRGQTDPISSSPTSATRPCIPPPLPRRRSANVSPQTSPIPPPLPPRQGSSSSRNNSLPSSPLPNNTSPESSPPLSQGSPQTPAPHTPPRISHSYTLPSPAPSLPRPTPRREQTLPSFEQAATAWGPFFNDDMTPTGVFSELMDAIFSYLDPKDTGYLLPEVYSRFLDDQGYMGQENAWKSACQPQPMLGIPKEYMADKALKNAYDLFSIEHAIQERPKEMTTPVVNPLTAQFQSMGINYDPCASFGTSMVGSNGVMPLLTRKGFMDITCVEVLCDPSRHWGNFSRIIRAYSNAPNAQAGPMAQYGDWPDLPRVVLPEMPDARMLERVKRVGEVAKAKAQEDLDAARVRTGIEAQGRQHALDLIGDYRYTYRYY